MLFVLGVYVTSIFAGAFAFGIGFDVGVTSFWDNWNKGVSRVPNFFMLISSNILLHLVAVQKQWKDIRQKYVQNDDE